MVENLSLENELLNARCDTLRNGLNNAKWLADTRQKQLIEANLAIEQLNKKVAKQAKIIKWLAIYSSAITTIAVILIK